MLFGTRYEATKIGINGFGRIGRMVFQVAGLADSFPETNSEFTPENGW